jgi:hypothetical protein
MKSRSLWFNSYLVLVVGLIGGLAAGCASTGKKKLSSLSLHLEANPDGSPRTQSVIIGRAQPFTLGIESAPFLTEYHLVDASVVDVMGNHQIMLQFDRQGSWLLEQYSVAGKSKQFAVFCQFPEPRWLAAPVFTKRISDGMLVFTPDATREEAERIVKGLNLAIKRNH